MTNQPCSWMLRSAAGAPDEDGDVIPVDVTFGGYRVRKLGPDAEGALTTEALVLDRRRKTYTTYYNTGCCFLSPPRLNPITLSGAVGGSALETLQLKNACTGAPRLAERTRPGRRTTRG